MLFYLILLPVVALALDSKPTITLQPSDEAVVLDNPLGLQCRAEGSPTPTVTWYNADTGYKVTSVDDDPVNSGGVHVNSEGRLLFASFKHANVGNYFCNASNSQGFAISRSAKAMVAYLDTKFNTEPVSKTVVLGSVVELECSPPSGVPVPNILWKKNGVVIDTASERLRISDKGHLYLESAKETDAGEYSCVATNKAATRQSASAILTVKSKPFFVTLPIDRKATRGSNVMFHCLVSGQPVPTQNWRKEGGTIDPARSKYYGNGSLSITDVQSIDVGKYFCEASNQEGRIEAIAQLTVETRPEFLETPTDQTVNEGGTAIFRCRVTGFPVPQVFWSKGKSKFMFAGNPPNDDMPQMRVGTDGTLTISKVRAEDESSYECHASSYMAPPIQTTAYLTVKRKDFLAPIIAFGPQSQKVTLGQDMLLHCSLDSDYVISNPDAHPVTIWFKDSQPLNIRASERMLLNLDGSLKIFDMKATDAGNYNCAVSVGIKQTLWPNYAHITVVSANIRPSEEVSFTTLPDPPTDVTVTDRGPDWILLKWHPPRNAPANVVYQVEYISHDLDSGWHIYDKMSMGSSVLRIEKLQPDTSYQFLVRSKTDQGLSKPSLLTNIVRTRPSESGTEKWKYSEIPVVLQQVTFRDISLQVIGKAKIRVTWTLRSDSLVALRHINGFHVKYSKVPISRCIDKSKINSDEILSYCSLSYKQDLDAYAAVWSSVMDLSRQKILHDLQQVTIRWRAENDNVKVGALLDNLVPFSCYQIYVESFYYQAIYGEIPGSRSPFKEALTWDSAPNSAPQNIDARWQSLSTLLITWTPPSLSQRNGILISYTIYLIGNSTMFDRRLQISNGSAQSCFVSGLVPSMQYMLHMSAANCRGEGIRSQPIVLPSAMLSLTVHDGNPFTQLWFIIALPITILICIFLLVCVVMACRSQYRNSKQNVDANVTRSTQKPLLHSTELPQPPDLLGGNAFGCVSFPMREMREMTPSCAEATPYASTAVFDHPALNAARHCPTYSNESCSEYSSSQVTCNNSHHSSLPTNIAHMTPPPPPQTNFSDHDSFRKTPSFAQQGSYKNNSKSGTDSERDLAYYNQYNNQRLVVNLNPSTQSQMPAQCSVPPPMGYPVYNPPVYELHHHMQQQQAVRHDSDSDSSEEELRDYPQAHLMSPTPSSLRCEMESHLSNRSSPSSFSSEASEPVQVLPIRKKKQRPQRCSSSDSSDNNTGAAAQRRPLPRRRGKHRQVHPPLPPTPNMC